MSESVFASQAGFLRQKNKELREDVESRIALSEHFMFDGFQAGAEAAKKELTAMLKICDRREAELCKVASD